MKNIKFLNTSRLLLVSIIISTFVFFAHAENFPFKVQRVKGNRAIIVVPNEVVLESGAVFNATKKTVDKKGLEGEGESEGEDDADNGNSARSSKTSRFGSSGLKGGSRAHIIGGDLSLKFLETKTSGAGSSVKSKDDSIDTVLSYGWNKETMEYGPVIEYSFTKREKTDSKKMLLGGFFDYNLTRNSGDHEAIPGIRLKLLVGQTDDSSFPKATSVTNFQIGFVYKYFGLDANMATIFLLGYQMETYTIDSAKTDISGVVARVGLQTYF